MCLCEHLYVFRVCEGEGGSGCKVCMCPLSTHKKVVCLEGPDCNVLHVGPPPPLSPPFHPLSYTVRQFAIIIID